MIKLSFPTTKPKTKRTTSTFITWLIACSFSYVGFAQETNQLYKHSIGYTYTTLCQGITLRMKIEESDQVEAFAGPIENDPNRRTTILGVRYLHTILQKKDFPVNPYMFAGFGYAASLIKYQDNKIQDKTELFSLMGYNAGIGMELKVTDRISINVEAAQMTLFNTQVNGPNLDGISLNLGIVYSFGGIF